VVSKVSYFHEERLCRKSLKLVLFTLGTLAQVGACPKETEKTSEMPKDILHLGHILRRQARASKPSWRPNPCQVRVHLRLQEQFIVKRMPRSHTDSIFDDPDIDGKII
jgi:hypothetical protein